MAHWCFGVVIHNVQSDLEKSQQSNPRWMICMFNHEFSFGTGLTFCFVENFVSSCILFQCWLTLHSQGLWNHKKSKNCVVCHRNPCGIRISTEHHHTVNTQNILNDSALLSSLLKTASHFLVKSSWSSVCHVERHIFNHNHLLTVRWFDTHFDVFSVRVTVTDFRPIASTVVVWFLWWNENLPLGLSVGLEWPCAPFEYTSSRYFPHQVLLYHEDEVKYACFHLSRPSLLVGICDSVFHQSGPNVSVSSRVAKHSHGGAEREHKARGKAKVWVRVGATMDFTGSASGSCLNRHFFEKYWLIYATRVSADPSPWWPSRRPHPKFSRITLRSLAKSRIGGSLVACCRFWYGRAGMVFRERHIVVIATRHDHAQRRTLWTVVDWY